MKRILFLLFSSLFIFPIYAQLNADHNSLRAGDVIIKQQVEFKDPGKAKTNQVWDFSQLQLINEEYKLVYSEAPLIGDSIYIMGYNQFPRQVSKYVDLIVGTEHNTMYYFIKQSILFLLSDTKMWQSNRKIYSPLSISSSRSIMVHCQLAPITKQRDCIQGQ